MKVIEIYSQRLARADKSGIADVFQYDEIPKNVLYQISQILSEVIGEYSLQHYGGRRENNNNEAWDAIIKALVRERGDPYLHQSDSAKQSCLNLLSSEHNLIDHLDLIDLAFRYVENGLSGREDYNMRAHGATLSADDAIKELNFRLSEGGVGYQFAGGQITRVDSQYLHSEVVVETLKLLNQSGFEGPEHEFREAHSHYRSGNLREAVSNAGHAFESTMKSICVAKKWEYERGARASDLLKILKTNGLFPNYLDNSFDQLLAVLKSGLPELRNNSGGHGAGPEPLKVPQHVASYAIHLAATNIVFLVECMKAI